jgi:predicted amidohydrolase
MGAEIIIVPSAFTYKTGQAHWEVLLRARAIENQCYIVAAAQAGKHNEKRESFGQSMIVDPWGKIVAQCDPHRPDIDLEEGEGSEGICYAIFDRAVLENIRESMPVNEHKRRDVYGLRSKL